MEENDDQELMDEAREGGREGEEAKGQREEKVCTSSSDIVNDTNKSNILTSFSCSARLVSVRVKQLDKFGIQGLIYAKHNCLEAVE